MHASPASPPPLPPPPLLPELPPDGRLLPVDHEAGKDADSDEERRPPSPPPLPPPRSPSPPLSLALDVTDQRTWSLHRLTRLLSARPRAADDIDERGYMPLHYAARCGAEEASLRLLIEHAPAALLHASQDGVMPLHAAARHGSAAATTFLLDQAPQAASILLPARKLSPFLLALIRAKPLPVNTLLRLLQAAPACAAQPTRDGLLPMHVAAQRLPDKRLLAALCDVNEGSVTAAAADGRLPLEMALTAAAVTPEAAALLLSPAGSSMRLSAGRLPLHVAAVHCGVDVIASLRIPIGTSAVDDSGSTPLHAALAAQRPPAVILQLLSMDAAQVDVVSPADGSPAAVACATAAYAGNLPLLMQLLPERCDDALMVNAVMHADYRLLQQVLQRASREAQAQELALLHIAIACQREQSVCSLLMQRSMVCKRVDDSFSKHVPCAGTALHVACFVHADQDVLVSLLALAGSAVLLSDSNGLTALHVAAKQNNLPAVESILASCPAAALARDTSGRTALSAAAVAGHCDCLPPLLQADRFARQRVDAAGRLPYQLAQAARQEEAARLLATDSCDASACLLCCRASCASCSRLSDLHLAVAMADSDRAWEALARQPFTAAVTDRFSGQLRLPLHTAVAHADKLPLSFLLALLAAYPAAAAVPDAFGQLPIHIASSVRPAGWHLLAALREAFPLGDALRDAAGQLVTDLQREAVLSGEPAAAVMSDEDMLPAWLLRCDATQLPGRPLLPAWRGQPWQPMVGEAVWALPPLDRRPPHLRTVEALQAHLDSHADAAKAVDGQSQTLLHIACGRPWDEVGEAEDVLLRLLTVAPECAFMPDDCERRPVDLSAFVQSWSQQRAQRAREELLRDIEAKEEEREAELQRKRRRKARRRRKRQRLVQAAVAPTATAVAPDEMASEDDGGAGAVVDWLATLPGDLSRYTDKLLAAGFDRMSLLPMMTADLLGKLSIPLVHRGALLQAVRDRETGSGGRADVVSAAADKVSGVGDCIICLDAVATTALVPCGHLCLCTEDAERLAGRLLAGHCPLCGTKPERLLRIYAV
eukprot:PLAT15048.1.p1 GENE.PLAT15048.1~~PLAT15048.1.p1  ORF type:complete len:1053 (+),score=268.82 PLAT15048.1:17-3175(+)